MSAKAEFVKVMEATEFYRDGKATAGVLTGDELLNPACPKHFRYRQVVERDKLGATAVFELREAPCIYFKYLADATPTPAQLTELRRIAWNNGLAPMLWVVTPRSVSIYNAYSKPLDNSENDHQRHLIAFFENVADGLKQLNALAGRLQIETGLFWQTENARAIDRSERVDESLLRDLARAEQELVTAGLPITAAHSLLGRSIFVAYLQDRGILSSRFFQSHFGVDHFSEVLENKEKTDRLFVWVRVTFNGDLFPLTSAEARSVKAGHLKIVKALLEGTDASGQMRLWPYQFDIIPVELISSIYEMFTHSADGKTARERSTHYTPIGLVDLVLSQVVDGLTGRARLLDMSCGSGVFLVESLRRLVSLRLAEGEELTRQLIRETLYSQVFGIDISDEAIQMTAFSLYLTTLELDPNPQPPSALKFRPLIGRSLFVADAFDEEEPFNQQPTFVGRGFDAIVGNPPWTRTSVDSSSTRYCDKRKLPLAQKGKPDQAFLWRAGDFCTDGARIGLVLSAKPFFSHEPHAREARKALLLRFSPQLLLNLSELHQVHLFPTAVQPAMVCILTGRAAEPGDTFVLASARRSDGFQAHGIIEVPPETANRLVTERAAADPDMLKVASWGTARDMSIVKRLRDAFPPLSAFAGEHAHGQGFKKSDNNRRRAPELEGKRLLTAGTMPSFRINPRNLPTFSGIDMHRRPSDSRIYEGPLVIATRGISRAGFYAAFSASDVVYDSLYYGFSLPEREAHYLNGVLNSRLATYWLFMTASTWGVERGELQPIDLLRLPVPSCPRADAGLVEAVVTATRQCEESTIADIGRHRRELDKAVYALYGVADEEVPFIEDLVAITLDERLQRSSSVAVKRPSSNQLVEYAWTLARAIQPLLAARGRRSVRADVLDTGPSPLTVIRFTLAASGDGRPEVDTVRVDGLAKAIADMERSLKNPITDQVFSRRVLRVYGDNRVFVIKPSQYRYWSRSAALNDFDGIMAEHLGAMGDGR